MGSRNKLQALCQWAPSSSHPCTSKSPNFANLFPQLQTRALPQESYRGNGSIAEIERQGKEKYNRDDGTVILRTVAFGPTQGKLEMCAMRRDVLYERGNVVLEGVGDKLPFAAGLMASYYYKGWAQGKRKGWKSHFNLN
ncbi:hypothetical protein MMC28_008593 [Mycoblastus sanguinarius]|nr:hypothetical protein [Mycoblastus sanguinarius]